MYFILFPLSKAFPSLGGGGQRLPLHNPRPAKRQKVVFIQPKKSWTHDFCLLAETNQSRTPSLTRLSAIKEAGLVNGFGGTTTSRNNGSTWVVRCLNFGQWQVCKEWMWGYWQFQKWLFDKLRSNPCQPCSKTRCHLNKPAVGFISQPSI